MKMNKDLLQKFINGECTPEQIAFIRSYLNQPNVSELDSLLASDWEKASDSEEDSQARQKIWKQLQAISADKELAKRGKIRNLFPVYAIAASIVLLIAIGLGIWISNDPDITPMMVQNNSTDPLFIVLDDQSQVWLTPGSKLSYPSRFEGDLRMVELEGEGFFDVVSDSTRPFLVNTGSIFTRVLGTSFNVRAFSKRDYIEVALISGAVEMKQKKDGFEKNLAQIKPGQKFYYHKFDHTFYKDSIESPAAYQWRSGMIYFEGLSIQKVAETLENWYHVSIQIDSSLGRNENLYHRIDTKSMGLDEVLDGINLVASYHRYEQVNDSLILVKGKK